MAPIDFAVRSAKLYAAPSRNKRAPSATSSPSILIGITVSIICVVVVIGTVCWLVRRKRKAVKSQKPSEIDTTFAGNEVKYRRISELPVSETVPPEYFESPQQTSNRVTTPESKTAARSDSSKEKECGTPKQVFSYNQRTLLELPSNEEVEFSHLRYAPANIGSSSNPQQNLIPAHVSPFDVELRPNPVYYSSFSGQSHTSDMVPPQEASVPNVEVPQIDKHIPFDFDLPPSDTEMHPGATSSDTDELLSQEPTQNSNEEAIDIEQEEASWPLSNDHDLAQDLSDPEVQMQIDHPKSSPKHGKKAVGITSRDSPHARLVEPVHAFGPASAPNLAPRKRVAGLDLRPLETANAKTEQSSNSHGPKVQRSKQARRPNQRTLIPKQASPQTLKPTTSPQSSKSTPDSARTDLSFASTATHTTSPASAITTPSLGAASPATPFSPEGNNLVCRDCGKIFHTPGGQKKHYNRIHNLRYVCDICMRPFGVRADLERHEHTVHAEFFRSNKRSWCTVPGCPTPNKEWKRKDNFTRHVRSCEARAAARATAPVSNGTTGKGKERAGGVQAGSRF